MPDHRELIHALNQRYYCEWLRAESLRRELALARLIGPFAGCLRGLKRLLFKPPPTAGLPACPTLEDPPTRPAGKVSVIIPFKDRLSLLRGCLRSLRRTADAEIVLVDNGSREAPTRRYLACLRRRGTAQVIDCPEPFNFSRLCNLGAGHAGGDYLLFLNNDTETYHEGWLDALVRLAARPDTGAVGATLLYPDQSVQHAGLFPDAGGRWCHAGRGLPVDTPGLDEVRVVPAVTAACLMMRRDLFVQLGGFDERLPLTYNDVDLCLRAAAAGKRNVVTPHARLLHYEGLSRGFAHDEPGAGHLKAMRAFPG